MSYAPIPSYMQRHVLTQQELEIAYQLSPLQRAAYENELYQVTEYLCQFPFKMTEAGAIMNWQEYFEFRGRRACILMILQNDDKGVRYSHPRDNLNQTEETDQNNGQPGA